MNYRNYIDKWPSLAEFAQDIGVSENTAKQMRTRDAINSRYWHKMVEAAKSRNIESITYEKLALIASEAA